MRHPATWMGLALPVAFTIAIAPAPAIAGESDVTTSGAVSTQETVGSVDEADIPSSTQTSGSTSAPITSAGGAEQTDVVQVSDSSISIKSQTQQEADTENDVKSEATTETEADSAETALARDEVTAGENSFPEAEAVNAEAGSSKAAFTSAVVDEQTEPTTVEELAAQNIGGKILGSGTYVITNQGYALDVADGSCNNGANVQIYQSNGTAGQEWLVKVDDEGFVTLKSIRSGMYLDVADALTANGTNIQQYPGNGTIGQRWAVRKSGNYITLVSALGLDHVLDLADGRAANSTNVQLYSFNDTVAQHWTFMLSEQGKLAAQNKNGELLSDGFYTIAFGGDGESGAKVLDIADGSTSNGANLQLYSDNGTAGQIWSVVEDEGYVTIYNVGSGKVLDIANGTAAAQTNVQQYRDNGTGGQKWLVAQRDDGTIELRSALNINLTLDLAWGRPANGTNVQIYNVNGAPAQSWRMQNARVASVNEGWNILHTAGDQSLAVDVKDLSTENGGTVQLHTVNGSQAQSWWLRKVSEGVYTIQASCSGLYLSDSGGYKQLENAGARSQWVIDYASRGGYLLRNLATNNILNFDGVRSFTINAATSAVVDGYYSIASRLNKGKVIDVADGLSVNGTNVQLYDTNKSNAQIFRVRALDDGTYQITNAASGKAVTPRDGEAYTGNNVELWTVDNSAGQRWRLTMGESGLEIRSAVGDVVIDVLDAKTDNGTNIQLHTPNGNKAQAWIFNVEEAPSFSGLDYCWLNSSELWEGMSSVKVKWMNTHYTSGREGNTIKMIVLHHNDGTLTTEGCWETWQTRAASAHYQVEVDGTVGQLVRDCDTAWHAGNWTVNTESIGIEHADASTSPYYLSDATIESGAHLVAALCIQYHLGRPTWGVNVTGHSDHSSTECPASLAVGGSQHDYYMSRAQYWYDKLVNA